jgi:acyl carrier protein
LPVQVREQLKQFVIESFLFGQQTDFRDDDSFLESGIIDSTGVLELVTFVEEGFGIKVQDSDLIPDNLDSIEKLTAFVQRRLDQTNGKG